MNHRHGNDSVPPQRWSDGVNGPPPPPIAVVNYNAIPMMNPPHIIHNGPPMFYNHGPPPSYAPPVPFPNPPPRPTPTTAVLYDRIRNVVADSPNGITTWQLEEKIYLLDELKHPATVNNFANFLSFASQTGELDIIVVGSIVKPNLPHHLTSSSQFSRFVEDSKNSVLKNGESSKDDNISSQDDAYFMNKNRIADGYYDDNDFHNISVEPYHEEVEALTVDEIRIANARVIKEWGEVPNLADLVFVLKELHAACPKYIPLRTWREVYKNVLDGNFDLTRYNFDSETDLFTLQFFVPFVKNGVDKIKVNPLILRAEPVVLSDASAISLYRALNNTPGHRMSIETAMGIVQAEKQYLLGMILDTWIFKCVLMKDVELDDTLIIIDDPTVSDE